MNTPFHLSLPCKSISETRRFYVEVLGAREGRATSGWIDIDLMGNQITFTKSGPYEFNFKSYKFEDAVLPAFHFGLIVHKDTWTSLYEKLNESGIDISPTITFLEGKTGQHSSFFLTDPNGHSVEFKTFADQTGVFGK